MRVALALLIAAAMTVIPISAAHASSSPAPRDCLSELHYKSQVSYTDYYAKVTVTRDPCGNVWRAGIECEFFPDIGFPFKQWFYGKTFRAANHTSDAQCPAYAGTTVEVLYPEIEYKRLHHSRWINREL